MTPEGPERRRDRLRRAAARMAWHRLALAAALICLAPLLIRSHGMTGAAVAVLAVAYAIRLVVLAGRGGRRATRTRRRRTVIGPS
ncbi:hypothetical protein CLV70_12547 [Pseudosporangium ferrugineum]|uniref:Uncharacterized protein n=1 Tax=Pseudosporangium ferrugineum TaxID=439699 RepID=A0A2T0RG36_9ACTN|nr:hypothetical protein CLV70_12547 [Pseudosporangium ferrugineum]